MLIFQTTPDEHPPTPSPCRWPVHITFSTLAKFQPVWRRLCDVSFRFSCSNTPLRPSVHYQNISLVVNIMCVQTFCDHLNILYIFDETYLYRVEVTLELYGVNARLIVRPPSPSPYQTPTPPPRQWPDITLYPPSPSFSSFFATCMKLCCLPPPSLVRNTRLCCLVYV